MTRRALPALPALLAPLLLLPLAGCPKLGALGDALAKYRPTVDFKEFKLRDISFDRADVDFTFEVRNPNPLEVNFSSFSYNLDLANHPFFDGVNPKGLHLEAKGLSELTVPVSVTFVDLLKTAGDIQGEDTVPYTFAGDFGFNTPLGELKIPFSKSGDFPVLRAPRLKLSKLRLDNFNLADQSARIELDLNLSHDQGSNLSFENFDYGLTLDGRSVATGRLRQLATVSAGQEKTVTLPVNLSLVDLGAALVNTLRNKSPVQVGLTASTDVGTPFGSVPWSLERSKRLSFQ
ncbi:MAG: LEA type 2 family protein [Alphaproteobacteria bacterium]|nr:LEA type 2 family protein [Alphaproteobacteria bacterium]